LLEDMVMAGRIIVCLRRLAPVLAVAVAAIARVDAQLLPPPGGGLVDVAITAPTAGDRVAGDVAVTASVGGVGAGTVASVQFKVDGVNLGAADTTAPYEATWSSNAASDGWRTLTAVARNSAGAEIASAPVTVRLANVAAPGRPTERYDDTNAAVAFSVGWLPRSASDWFSWSGGNAMQAMTPGASATFAFTGPSVAWIGYRSLDSGIARVLVDGFFVAEVDLFARREEARAHVFTVGGLTDTSHTLTIEVTGRKNAESSLPNVVIDAFDVAPTPVSRQQETSFGVSVTSGWTADTTRPSWSGAAALVSAVPGAQATFTFRAAAVEWLGYRGPDGGIARVFLDGALAAEVDTYSPQVRMQDPLFVAADLAAGVEHTLTIESTGQKHAASTGASIAVDAFEITGVGERFEETEWAVTYAGTWTHNNYNKPFSGGASAVTLVGGARTTFSFSGTGVSWIGARAERTGIAHVFIDGAHVTTVDTYSPNGEGFQETLFTATGLVSGAHTLAIEATGTKNPVATNTYIVIDAFDVVH
jgi:Big-like domain-containing protein